MSITFQTAAADSTFADLFTDSDDDTTWYRLWTGNEAGTEGAFVDTFAFNRFGNGWIEADDLSSLLADYAQYDDTTLWVQTYSETDGAGDWESGSIDFTAIDGVSPTIEVFGDTTFDLMFTDTNLPDAGEVWYQFWIGNEAGTQGALADTVYGKGWVLSTELAHETFTAADPGGFVELWVRTWTTVGGFGDWEHWTVTTDDGPAFSVADASVAEGDSGTTTLTFTVTLDRAPGTGETVTVDYTTADGSAVSEEDYSAASGTLTFTAGVTTQTVTVTVNTDTKDEEDESFTLELSNAAGTIAGLTPFLEDDDALGTIIDDDLSVASCILTESCNSITEGETVTYTVTAVDENGDAAPVTADTAFTFTVAGDDLNGAAYAGSADDVSPASGTVTIAAGASTATFTLTAVSDGSSEGLEGLLVSILDEEFTVVDSETTAIIDSGEITYSLTTGTDNITGGDGNDTFAGTLPYSNGALSASATYNEADALDGGGGTDEFILSVTGSDLDGAVDDNETITPTLSNIEIFSVKNYETDGDSDVVIDLSLSDTSLATVGVTASTHSDSDTIFQNLGTSADFVHAGYGDMTVTFDASVNTGSSDSANVTFNDSGSSTATATFDITGIETLNVTSATAANYIRIAGADLEAVTLAGDQDIDIIVDEAITSFDASAATGTVSADLSAAGLADLSVVAGGSADDDVLILGEDVTVSDISNDLETVSGFETLALNTADTVSLSSDDGGITDFDLSDSNNQTLSLNTGYTSDTTVAVESGDTVENQANVSLTVSADSNDFSSATRIEGGTGTDTIQLTAAAGTVELDNVSGIETITLLEGTAHTVTMDVGGADNTVASGDTLVIDATALTGSTAALTFTGTGETDGGFSVTGSSGNDSLTGGGGNDALDGGDGDDTVDGGDGDDSLAGGDGNDTILAGSGIDTLSGGDGNDTFELAGNLTDADTIDGGDGTDTLTVTAFDADMVSNVSNVEILALSGGISVELTKDLDFIIIDMETSAADETVTFGSGYTNAATVRVEDGDSVMNTAADIHLTVEADSDDLEATDNTILTGSDADDVTDTLDATNTGGTIDLQTDITGFDMINIIDNETTAGLAIGIDVTAYGDTGDTLAIDASELDSGEDLTITGTATADLSIVSGGGEDTLVLGLGDDKISGGSGNDSLTAGTDLSYKDTVDGGDGTDAMTVTALTDVDLMNVSNVEHLTVTTSATLGYYASQGGVTQITTVADAAIDATGMTTDLTVYLGDGTNTDSVTLGQGDDTIVFDADVDMADTDSFDGVSGSDTIRIDNNTGTDSTGDAFSGTLDDITSIDTITINDLADDNADGDVTLMISNTDYDQSSLTVDASALDDGEKFIFDASMVSDTDEVFTVTGGAGDDSIVGGAGNDAIDGGAGNDIIFGVNGGDSLTGGSGSDTFAYIFETVIGSGLEEATGSNSQNTDTITDFSAGTDSIRVSLMLVSDLTVDFSDKGDEACLGDGLVLLSSTIGEYYFCTGTSQLAMDIDGNGLINANDLLITLSDETGFDSGDIDFYISATGGTNTITVGDGDNTIVGGNGDDTIATGAGSDTIEGEDGDDIINAGDGNDLITGGDGSDVFTTGAGEDVLIFDVFGDADTVTDFASDTDRVIVDDTSTTIDNLVNVAGTATTEFASLAATAQSKAIAGTSGNLASAYLHGGGASGITTVRADVLADFAAVINAGHAVTSAGSIVASSSNNASVTVSGGIKLVYHLTVSETGANADTETAAIGTFQYSAFAQTSLGRLLLFTISNAAADQISVTTGTNNASGSYLLNTLTIATLGTFTAGDIYLV